ncbi:MAG: extracellular matrix regulator RemB [Acutalibacteraceae bacterium]
MFLHLGQNTVIHQDDIIGIFDLDNTTVSKKTRDFLAKKEKEGRVVNVSYELPKSFVLCENKNKEITVYITQISTSTLIKRVKNSDII